MMLRWVKASPTDEGILFVRGDTDFYSGMRTWKLQVGDYCPVPTECDDGTLMTVMEVKWQDIPVEEP